MVVKKHTNEDVKDKIFVLFCSHHQAVKKGTKTYMINQDGTMWNNQDNEKFYLDSKTDRNAFLKSINLETDPATVLLKYALIGIFNDIKNVDND